MLHTGLVTEGITCTYRRLEDTNDDCISHGNGHREHWDTAY